MAKHGATLEHIRFSSHGCGSRLNFFGIHHRVIHQIHLWRRGDEGLQMMLSALPALPPCFEQGPWPIDHIHHEPAKK